MDIGQSTNIQLRLPENFQDSDHCDSHRQCVFSSTQARPHRVSHVDSPERLLLPRRHANAGKGRRAPILRLQLNAEPNRRVHHRTSEGFSSRKQRQWTGTTKAL